MQKLLDGQSQRVLDVRHCSACGKDHLRMRFRPVQPKSFEYVAICPATYELVYAKEVIYRKVDHV